MKTTTFLATLNFLFFAGKSQLPSDAISAYVHYCGEDIVCWTDDRKRAVSSFHCPRCSCSYWCAENGDCCMDKYPLDKVILTTTSFFHWNLNHVYLYAVGICPENTSFSLNSLCTQDWRSMSDFEFFPVRDYNDVYKNKYCALCHDITVWDPLSVSLDCKSEMKLHTYTSVETLLADAEKLNCEVIFEEEFAHHHIAPVFIHQCNISGLWENYAVGVEWACLNYYHKYKIFKNLFCYFCNVGRNKKDPYINSCIRHDMPATEQSCVNGDVDGKFYPYQNSFCKECNGIPVKFLAFRGIHVPSEFGSLERYEWVIDLQLYDILYDDCGQYLYSLYPFLQISPTYQPQCATYTNGTIARGHLERDFLVRYDEMTRMKWEQHIDLNIAYERYKSYGGNSTWCFDENNNTKDCSCLSRCIKFRNCCPDNPHVGKIICRKINGRNVPVVASCPRRNTDKILLYYCERNDTAHETVFDFLHVYDKTSTFSHWTGTIFKNIFCALCNIDHEPYFYQGSLMFNCPRYLDADNYLPFLSTFREIMSECIVEVSIPDDIGDGTCAMPVDPSSPFNSLQHLCEETGSFIYSICDESQTNIFCEMSDMEANCKNGTCDKQFDKHYCNTSVDRQRIDKEDAYQITHSYLLKFNLIPNENISDKSRAENTSTECKENEFYDRSKDLCREILCPQGKIYVNGSCVSLVTKSNIWSIYILSLQADVMDTADNTRLHVQDVLDDFYERMKNEILFHSSRDTFLSRALLQVERSCRERVTGAEFKVKGFYQIRTKPSQGRDEMDGRLLSIIQSHLFLPNFNISFALSTDRTSLLYQDYIKAFDYFLYSCVIEFEELSRGLEGYVSSHYHVDKFLLCAQISLQPSDYDIISEQKLRLRNRRYGEDLDYALGTEPEVRVCIDDLRSVIRSVGNSFHRINNLTLGLLLFYIIRSGQRV